MFLAFCWVFAQVRRQPRSNSQSQSTWFQSIASGSNQIPFSMTPGCFTRHHIHGCAALWVDYEDLFFSRVGKESKLLFLCLKSLTPAGTGVVHCRLLYVLYDLINSPYGLLLWSLSADIHKSLEMDWHYVPWVQLSSTGISPGLWPLSGRGDPASLPGDKVRRPGTHCALRASGQVCITGWAVKYRS